MFSKAVYWHSIYSGATTDPAAVARDFLQDIRRARPVFVGENKSRLFVTFRDSERMTAYALPLAYKAYIPEV